MKRPTMLYRAMMMQITIDLEVSTERDFGYIQSRLEHEGLSFLTITLPTLSDSLESGLESGLFTLPIGFKPYKRNGTLPALLQGLFKRVFQLDGSLRSDACPKSIYWIRQVSRFFKKPKIACSPQREAEAVRRFKAVEEELYDRQKDILREDKTLDQVAGILWSTVFPTVDDNSIICGHGPGVTADRRLSNERRRIRYWYQRFESSFPIADHAYANYGQAWDAGSSSGVSGVTFLDVSQEYPVRVVFVPKTLQAPRVIAIEPSSMQFVQQGLSRYMTRIVESHRLTRNSVRFSDQTVNRELAYKASIDRSLATIDLSDASDRVHNALVNRIFQSSPILEYLQDARSLHADLPDGSNVILNKYASMGSALCFPVEACVFYTLVLSAIIKSAGLRPSYRTIMRLSKRIAVFGDDIVVPTEYVDAVSDYLESYVLRVNRRKSFSKSAFRESCGSDYYNGYSVLPVYARMTVPEDNSEWTPSHIMSWIATSDQFYLTGSWHLAQCIRDLVECVLRRRLPRSRRQSQGLAFASLLFDTNLSWFQAEYAWKQRRLYYKPLKQKDVIDGDATACFNKVFESNRDEYISRLFHGAHSERHDICQERRQHQSMVGESAHCGSGSSDSSKPATISRQLGDLCESRSTLGVQYHPCGRMVPYDLLNVERFALKIDPSRIDFHNTTKRGVFALKRQWVTIVS